jgi:hypothetical protein
MFLPVFDALPRDVVHAAVMRRCFFSQFPLVVVSPVVESLPTILMMIFLIFAHGVVLSSLYFRSLFLFSRPR